MSAPATTFSLSGFLGLSANDFGDLADTDSVNWTFVPGLRWRIFDGGRIRNNIRALRFQAGEMTQQALADRVGITRQTVIALMGLNCVV